MVQKLVKKAAINKKLRGPRIRGLGGVGRGGVGHADDKCNCWCQCGEICSMYDCHGSMGLDKLRTAGKLKNVLGGKKR